MQGLIYFAVFVLLAGGAFLILNLSFVKRKSKITLSKLAADDRRKKVDEKYSKLTLFERIMVNIKETVTMSGFKMNTFWMFVVLAGFGGLAAGTCFQRVVHP